MFSHTYADGGIYNVIHKATDSGGRMKSELISVHGDLGRRIRREAHPDGHGA